MNEGKIVRQTRLNQNHIELRVRFIGAERVHTIGNLKWAVNRLISAKRRYLNGTRLVNDCTHRTMFSVTNSNLFQDDHRKTLTYVNDLKESYQIFYQRNTAFLRFLDNFQRVATKDQVKAMHCDEVRYIAGDCILQLVTE